MKRTMLAAAVAVLTTALGAACAGPAATPIVVYVTPPPVQAVSVPTPIVTPTPAPPSTALHTMTVEITLFDPTAAGRIVNYGATECAGWGAYHNFDAGIKAMVEDADANILAVATFDHHGQTITKNGASTTECRLTSTSVDVPDSPLYAVDLGGAGCLLIELADIEASGWVAGLTVGDKKGPLPPPTPRGPFSSVCHSAR